jgi:cell division inhibitor SepF
MSVIDNLKRFFEVNENEPEETNGEQYEYEEIKNNPEVLGMESHQRESLVNNPYSDRNSLGGAKINMNKNNANNNVVGMRGLENTSAEVMVIEPQSFDDMPKVIDALRDRKSVVLNLEKMDPEKAQRSVDFVAGGTYARDGHFERVGDNIFLFTPSCVTVSNLSGLVSIADDFANARNRRPGNSNNTVNDAMDYWTEPSTAAQ